MPKLLTTPFASEATSEYRTDVQNSTGAEPNSATYKQGFPPVTMEKIANGGKPPKGSDLNGVLYDITDNLVSLTKGARYGFNEAYATAIGGYPLGAVLRLDNGVEVESEVDSNSINPNVDMTGWKLAVSDNGILTWSGRTQEQKNKENPSMLDFKAVGDGVTNDTQAYLDAIEFSKETGILVEGLGKTYFTTTRGSILNALKNATIKTVGDTLYFDNLGTLSLLNLNKAPSRYSFVSGAMPLNTGWNKVVAIGADTLKQRTAVDDVIAIGRDILTETIDGEVVSHNLAIGDSSLKYLKPDSSISNLSGTRNVALGSLAMHFATGAYMNVAVGRDTLHNIQNGGGNTAIGYTAHGGGYSPVGWSGNIELQLGRLNSSPTKNTAVGMGALYYNTSDQNTAVGADSLASVKQGQFNTAVGYLAGNSLDHDKSWENTKILVGLNITGSYTIVGNTVTVILAQAPAIALADGYSVGLAVSTGDLTVECGKAVITSVINTTTFTIDSPVVGAVQGGDLILKYLVTNVATGLPLSQRNTLLGTASAENIRSAQNSVAVGHQALQGVAQNIRTDSNVAVGFCALKGINGASSNNTAIGTNAMLNPIAGLNNSTAIGQASDVTGSNQVQLGNSQTTTYVYGTVQNRSDKRDKADIRDTTLGLNFINSLRPVDYKLDMREDYIETLEDGTVVKHEKDGSKKRERYHHGFIAQEVGALGDFGGYQDHKINGGADVLSLGYDEFIAPLVKAMQELSKEVDFLKKQLESK